MAMPTKVIDTPAALVPVGPSTRVAWAIIALNAALSAIFAIQATTAEHAAVGDVVLAAISAALATAVAIANNTNRSRQAVAASNRSTRNL